ncbi:MAG: SsrA-binding protein SmpB [Bacilli bacterium]|nr:SsrA-binding protein SmpB [Bacilli bacterium]
MEVINRETRYKYFILEELECGIALTGTEIKSIRSGKVNLKDSYALIRNHEIYLVNTHIASYKEGNIFNHDERRSRKLLLHKKEILKLESKVDMERLTLIPLKLYFNKNKVKILLGLCRGKKTFDKRETIKKRELEREASKLNKYNYK